MIKINSIKINGVTRNIENIAYLTSLPTASAESPDFVSVDGVLYAKAYVDSTYTYKNLAQSLTAGDNIAISEDGVISVTGELGTQIEANPELAGDETTLSSISIDGVNYEIAGGAPITPVEVLPDATEEELVKNKIYEKDGTLGYLFNKALEEPVYNTLTVDAQISTSARTKMVTYKNKLYFTNGSSLYEFDPSTNTQTLLYTDSSYLISNAGIAAYNDLIYLFGAHTYSSSKVYHTYSRVLTYDLNTKTTTTRASLPDECIDMGCVVVGNCAYLFGGRYLWYAYSYNHTTCKSWILKYNLDSNTCSQLSGSYQSGWGQVALAHDTDIYVFGGVDDSEYGSGSSKAIYKFNTVNETMTKLSTTLPNAGYSLEGVNVQGQLYIYGGTSSTRIYKFNPVNNTIATLTATLGSSRNGCGSALWNDTAYIIGGGVTSIGTLTFGSQIQYTTLPTLDVVNNLLDTQKQTINAQKQDKLTAGTGISISGSTINAYNTLTAGEGISIDGNVINCTSSGIEIVDISGLDTIPESYQDINKLMTCYLQDSNLIYHLSWINNTEAYFECTDDLYYNNIIVNFETFGISKEYSDLKIITQDSFDDSLATKQDKLTAGRNIQITEDGIIGIANPNNCKVVSELPTPTVELANEETIYSYDGKLYNIVYNPEDPSDIHYQQLTYGDASFNPYFKDTGLVLDELADEDMSGGMWVYTPVRGE